MAEALRPHLTPETIGAIPLTGAGVAGTVFALAAIAVPAAWFENAVSGSGLPALLPVAEPPLGTTARALLALGGGVVTAAVVWAALYLLFGPGGPLAAKPRARGAAPVVRRADAHPDAPPRWPLSAAELASPSGPPPMEKPLPTDLDVPLAQLDPTAVLPVPREPVRAVKPLAAVAAPVLEPGERLETFTLTPPPPPPPASDEPPSIDALLRRLEQGAQRRAARTD